MVLVTSLSALIGLIALLHLKSLPFAWHIRLFLIGLRAKYTQTSFFLPPSSPRIQRSSPHLLLDSLPIGRDILSDTVIEHFRVGLDDGDFLGHLSNSSYAKNLDFARMSFALQRLPLFHREGGWTALGAIQFRYLNEIRIGRKYNIRVQVIGWEEKWFYVRSTFYTSSVAGSETINCISTSRHCFKVGRHTVPPWLVFATAGYAPEQSKTPLSNWEKTEAVRLSLEGQAGKKADLLATWSKDVGTEREKEWMRKQYWDTEGWEQRREIKTDKISLAL